MSNGSNVHVSNAPNSLLESAGDLMRLPLDLLNGGIRTTVQIVEPLAKTAIDLLGSLLNAVGQGIQGVLSIVTPKK